MTVQAKPDALERVLSSLRRDHAELVAAMRGPNAGHMNYCGSEPCRLAVTISLLEALEAERREWKDLVNKYHADEVSDFAKLESIRERDAKVREVLLALRGGKYMTVAKGVDEALALLDGGAV